MNRLILLLSLAWSAGAPGQTPPLTFTTSVSGTGDLSSWADSGGMTGLEGADNVCRARAAAAGHPGEFVAYMSDDRDSAYCRVHGLTGSREDLCGQATLPDFAGPWVRTDGHPLGGTLAEMIDDQRVYVPPVLDEFGQPVPRRTHFGTTDVTVQTCGRWSSAAQGAFAASGSNFATAYTWDQGITSACFIDRHLLCMEVRQTATPAIPIPQPPANAALAFLDSRRREADFGGAAQADQFCQEAANLAGLANPNQFMAWLSEDNLNAAERLRFNGPWVRPDGVLVAQDAAELASGRPFSPIFVTAEGDSPFVSRFTPAPIAWTGTDEFGLATPDNCANWTSTDFDLSGQFGVSNRVNNDWTRFNNGIESSPASCDRSTAGFYCLGQVSALTLFADGFE